MDGFVRELKNVSVYFYPQSGRGTAARAPTATAPRCGEGVTVSPHPRPLSRCCGRGMFPGGRGADGLNRAARVSKRP